MHLIQELQKLFPDAKFLYIVRDGRDVTCSLMGKHSKWHWAHMKPTGWQDWQKKHKSGPLKYAWQWNETINIVNQDKSNLNPEDFVEIKYEDFVFNPKEVMQKVFSIFEIPFEKPQQELCKKVDSDMRRELEATPGWTKSDHSNSVGRYKENLTPEELVEVEKILGENNNQIQKI